MSKGRRGLGIRDGSGRVAILMVERSIIGFVDEILGLLGRVFMVSLCRGFVVEEQARTPLDVQSDSRRYALNDSHTFFSVWLIPLDLVHVVRLCCEFPNMRRPLWAPRPFDVGRVMRQGLM